ncbi:hypothetical protein PMAC_001592 [Pneumocystis sp. 'macacae']|nr:hypothetical protein PMAC_001592 [Pneumocystis sp. 'macacae']
MFLRRIPKKYHINRKNSFERENVFLLRLKNLHLGRCLSINLQQTKEIKVKDEATKYLDKCIFKLEDFLYSGRVDSTKEINDDVLKYIFRISLLSLPKDNEKNEIIKEITKHVQFSKHIDNVDISNVEKLVTIRKDKPIRLVLDEICETKPLPKWNVLGLTKNKEGDFFVVHKKNINHYK